jgi:hypothetical protein
MESVPKDNSDKAADGGKRPGGTLLRFKKLTNHLFGRADPAEQTPPPEKKG